MGDRQNIPLYFVYRTDQLDLRLSDFFSDALCFPLLAEPRAIPHGLVCGVTLYPDADHSYYSNEQDPLY